MVAKLRAALVSIEFGLDAPLAPENPALIVREEHFHVVLALANGESSPNMETGVRFCRVRKIQTAYEVDRVATLRCYAKRDHSVSAGASPEVRPQRSYRSRRRLYQAAVRGYSPETPATRGDPQDTTSLPL